MKDILKTFLYGLGGLSALIVLAYLFILLVGTGALDKFLFALLLIVLIYVIGRMIQIGIEIFKEK